MKLAEMIAYVQRGVFGVAFSRNEAKTRISWIVTCNQPLTDELRQEMDTMAAQEEEMMKLCLLGMLHDVRLCPTPDDHRATYVYNREHAVFCCEACAVERAELLAQFKADLAKTTSKKSLVDEARQ